MSDPDDLINLRNIVDSLVSLVKGIVNDNLSLNLRMDQMCENFAKFNRIETCGDNPETAKVNEVLPNINQTASSRQNHQVTSNRLLTSNNRTVESLRSIDESKVEESGTSTIESELVTNSEYKRQFPALISSENNQSCADPDNQWHTWTGKNRRKREKKVVKPIIGTKTSSDTEGSKVRAINKLSWVFVSRLDKDCTKEDISEYLGKSNIKGDCVALTPKHNSYMSFKIGVPENLTSKLLTESFGLWVLL